MSSLHSCKVYGTAAAGISLEFGFFFFQRVDTLTHQLDQSTLWLQLDQQPMEYIDIRVKLLWQNYVIQKHEMPVEN